MPRCPATKRDGGQWTTIVGPEQTYCYQHDPERAEERKRNASRAGKSGGKEVRALKRRISEVIEAVLEGSQDRGRAAVAIQGFNVLRGVLELERKIREQEEVLERLAALEQTQEGGRRWRA
jgi:broad specificity phosphatase PhoE